MKYRIDYYENPPIGELTLSETCYRLCYCQRGRLSNVSGSSTASLTHGDVFILPPWAKAEVSISVVQTVFYIISFEEDLFFGEGEEITALRSFLTGIGTADPLLAKISLPPEEIVFFESVLSKIKNNGVEKSGSHLFGVLSLLSTLSEIMNNRSLLGLSERYGKESFIKYCVLYIDAHCTENISLEDITRLSATPEPSFVSYLKERRNSPFPTILTESEYKELWL